MKWIATECAWFSAFFEKPLLNRVNRSKLTHYPRRATPLVRLVGQWPGRADQPGAHGARASACGDVRTNPARRSQGAAVPRDRPWHRRADDTVLPQANAYAMIRRRAAAAGIETKLGNHSFRATGITAYLKNGGTLEKAAAMANHASTRTTQLYDRRRDEVSLDEVERIVI
jgi:hypothetical protein